MKFKIQKLNFQLLPHTWIESLKAATNQHLAGLNAVILSVFEGMFPLSGVIPHVVLKPISLCSYDCSVSLLLHAECPLVSSHDIFSGPWFSSLVALDLSESVPRVVPQRLCV